MHNDLPNPCQMNCTHTHIYTLTHNPGATMAAAAVAAAPYVLLHPLSPCRVLRRYVATVLMVQDQACFDQDTCPSIFDSIHT